MATTEEWHSELERRRATIWSIVQKAGCDGCIVFGSEGHAEPFRYLTNFVPALGDSWAILTGPQTAACVLNFDWQLPEARQVSGIDTWYGIFDPLPTIVEILQAAKPKRIAVVGLHRLPVTAYEVLKTRLPDAAFVDIGADVAALRRIKSPLEIDMLREAARITDSAFDAVRPELRPGITEFEVCALLGYTVQSCGAEWAFWPCVISGTTQPIMIRQPSERRLQVGDSVMIDIGAAYKGYQADATRTYVLGQPNAVQQRVWATVQRAYDAALALARPGTPCKALHEAAVKIIEDAGYRLVHRIGHGIGLATSFEWPSLNTETGPLMAGMTICLEPGIYVPGAGNMKLEDDVLITESGCEVLTNSSRDTAVSA